METTDCVVRQARMMSQEEKRESQKPNKQTSLFLCTYILALGNPNQWDRLSKGFAMSRASHRLPKTLRQLHPARPIFWVMCCKVMKKGRHYVMYEK